MTTYCDYCMLTGHTRFSCPALRSTKEDADSASLEELEAAAELWDRREEQDASRAIFGEEEVSP